MSKAPVLTKTKTVQAMPLATNHLLKCASHLTNPPIQPTIISNHPSNHLLKWLQPPLAKHHKKPRFLVAFWPINPWQFMASSRMGSFGVLLNGHIWKVMEACCCLRNFTNDQSYVWTFCYKLQVFSWHSAHNPRVLKNLKLAVNSCTW